jgi:hypothetical protein
MGRRCREEGGGGLGMVCVRLGFQGKMEQRGLGQWKNWRGERAEGASRRTEGRRGRGWGRGEATGAQVFTYQVLFSFWMLQKNEMIFPKLQLTLTYQNCEKANSLPVMDVT